MITQPTRIDGRSKAARDANLESIVAMRRDRAPANNFNKPEILEAASAVERAQAVRKSIRRKLLGGSLAVESSDLTSWENQLASARAVLSNIAPDHPLIIASALIED